MPKCSIQNVTLYQSLGQDLGDRTDIKSHQGRIQSTGKCPGRWSSSHYNSIAWEGSSPPSKSWMLGCILPLPHRNPPPCPSSALQSHTTAHLEPPNPHSHEECVEAESGMKNSTHKKKQLSVSAEHRCSANFVYTSRFSV